MITGLRIRGLVRAMRYVQDRMARGVPPSEAGEFLSYVGRVVSTVERLCREHRTHPAELPRPSREAYEYLATLAESGAQPPIPRAAQLKPTASVANVLRTTSTILAAVDARLAKEPRATVVADSIGPIRDAVRQIEEACRKQARAPSDMPPPSRRAYGLLAFLAADGALTRYADTVAKMRTTCTPLLTPKTAYTPTLHVRLDDQNGIYRYHRRGDAWTFRLNPGFMAAGENVLQTVAEEAFHGKRRNRRAIIHEFVHSEEFLGIGQEIADIVAGEPQTNGATYDLAEVCESVRLHYFDAPAAAPASLAWTDRLTYRTFGHYSSLRDRITISRSLDDADVPRYVIEFIMYHELLHRVHGIGWATSRRAVHTAAFRRDEQKFPRYEQAQAFINRYAERLRQRTA